MFTSSSHFLGAVCRRGRIWSPSLCPFNVGFRSFLGDKQRWLGAQGIRCQGHSFETLPPWRAAQWVGFRGGPHIPAFAPWSSAILRMLALGISVYMIALSSLSMLRNMRRGFPPCPLIAQELISRIHSSSSPHGVSRNRSQYQRQSMAFFVTSTGPKSA